MCVCVCVCERERERERKCTYCSQLLDHMSPQTDSQQIVSLERTCLHVYHVRVCVCVYT